MRTWMEFAFPLLMVGLGYVGLNTVATKAHWSLVSKVIVRSIAVTTLVVMFLYDYVAERPIIESLRETAGNAFCRYFVIERCPDHIKVEVADAEAQRLAREANALERQNRIPEAALRSLDARKAADSATQLRQQANDKLSLARASVVVKDALGVGTKIRKSAVLGDFAVIGWSQEPMGGEALLKFDQTTGQWRLIEIGGGAWSTNGLAKAAGIPREKAKALLDKVPIGMDRQ
jgi:hypothetical protein